MTDKNGEEPEGINPNVLRAMSHRTRVKIVEELDEANKVTSPSEFTRKLGGSLSVSAVSYHFIVLKECGVLEFVRLEEGRGGAQHIYRSVGPVVIGMVPWSDDD